MGIAWLLSSWSRKQDQTGNPRYAWKSVRLSGFAAVVYGVSIHFAALDWAMSLQPLFHSTIFGPLFASGQLLSAHAFACIVFAWLLSRPGVAAKYSTQAQNDLGSLLLTFLILWAYLVWFQFMLVWIANLPVDVVWYLPLVQGGWRAVAWSVFVLHFAVPFFLLLLRSVKRDPAKLAWVAGLLLFMQLVFMYFQVMPPFHADSLGQHWMDFLTPIALGGIWLAYFLQMLKTRPLLPRHDMNEAQAVRLRELDEEEAAREEAASHA
jgi:hypothetical protein